MKWPTIDKEKAKLTRKLNKLLPEVMEITGYSQQSLNAKIGGKHAEFLDIRQEVITSPDQFVAQWMNGMIKTLESYGVYRTSSNIYELFEFIKKNEIVRDYTFTFLERTYLRNYQALSKERPADEEAIMWIGQTNASYGILITPRFNGENWENDKSEIRHFKKGYWTIGHILETGLVIPYVPEIQKFYDIEQYLTFFKNTIVRNSGSQYEMGIAERYCDFVRKADEPENVPLLIPEFRYGGIAKKHEYRLDFTIINPITLDKYGFELSPWSSHGYLAKTKGRLQKDINAEAQGNFEREMQKHKDFFWQFGIFVLIYTDRDLANIDGVFDEMKRFLNPQAANKQLKAEALENFLNYS